MLFDITKTPFLIKYNSKNNYWLIDGKKLTKQTAERLTIKENVVIDISNLQWYQQEELKECFNLN